uniref:Uncharacterized protein n=1 Tax=Anguilla anguilla TaxID=7936 RepID=A0A0E9QT18_ANGAN
MHSVNCIKFGGKGIMIRGCFSWFEWAIGTLVQVKGTLNTTAYNDLLRNFCASKLCGYSLGRLSPVSA